MLTPKRQSTSGFTLIELLIVVAIRRVWRVDPEAAERAAKETVRSIYSEASRATNEDDAKVLGKWAVSSESARRIAAMLELARSETSICARPERFDRDPYLLNVHNGILDLRSGELQPHRADAYLTKLAGAAYLPDATCPRWIEFLKRIFEKNGNLISYIQRAIGYSLTGAVGERCLFLCWGTGHNGKSTLLNTVRRLMGDYAQHASFDAFLTQQGQRVRSDLASLAGARFVTAIEADEGRRLAEGIIKAVTGNDPLTASFKFKDEFTFEPKFKLWFATNHKPRVTDTTSSIWGRIKLIPFTVEIPESERDPDLLEKLTSELSGISQWAVAGCLAWQRDEGLHEPDEVRLATATYRTEMDVMAAFLSESCVVLPEASVSARDIFKAYSDWAESYGERTLTQTAFGLRLAEKGFTKGRSGTGNIVWKGVGLENRGLV